MFAPKRNNEQWSVVCSRKIYRRPQSIKIFRLKTGTVSYRNEMSKNGLKNLKKIDYKNRIIARCSPLVETSNGATMIYLQQ